eukprot:g8667.t1
MSVASLSINSLPLCVLHRIFNELKPRDLCRASSVCQLWRKLNRDNFGQLRWRRLYATRWSLQKTQNHEFSYWCDIYREKVMESNAWLRKYSQDALIGHRASIRSIQILPHLNLIASGSVDRTVKLWDLTDGMLISSSRMHSNTVRSLLMERHSYEDSVCIYSGSDSTIRVWKIDLTTEESKEFGKPMKLKGHTGPVSCLGSTPQLLLSGSWDCRVSLWRKQDGVLQSQLVFPDWIWALDVKQETMSLACGRMALVQDLERQKTVLALDGFVQKGHITTLEMTEDRRHLFTGATDGTVRHHDLRSKRQVAEIDYHSSGVTDVSFEDPWIAVSSLDGTISLNKMESRLHSSSVKKKSPERTNRHLACPSGPVYCLQMTNQWLACGAEQSIVRTWNFNISSLNANTEGVSLFHHTTYGVRKTTELELSHHVDVISERDVKTRTGGEGGLHFDSILQTKCRLDHRPQWTSFSGESTDESEIIEAFG